MTTAVATPFSGLGPAWTAVIVVIVLIALVAGTVWADRQDRRNPR